jgi:hypothetical protein
MPTVLDKLDDAALARAQRTDTTAEIASVLHGKTTEAALERLMTAVHEGTDAARIELAAGLPALVDFDDEDDEALPTVVNEEAPSLVAVECPLATLPMVMPEVMAPAVLPASARRSVLPLVLAGLAIVLVAGFVGYAVSASASSTPTAASATTSTPASARAGTSAVPVFVPSALPEAPPITPDSLPEAKP